MYCYHNDERFSGKNIIIISFIVISHIISLIIRNFDLAITSTPDIFP